MTQTISTIVDSQWNNLHPYIVYMTQTISTIVDERQVTQWEAMSIWPKQFLLL